MLPDNGKKVKIRNNYHMSTKELQLMFKHAANYGLKWQLLIGLQAFRGLRLSEALAVHVDDFSKDFDKLTWREAKVNKIQNNRPLIEPLSKLCRLYVKTHHRKLREGYLFHPYNKLNRKFMNITTAGALITKIRRDISKEHPDIMEHYLIRTDSGHIQKRYRVSWHSLRRWFEQNLKEKSDVYVVKTIMDYSKYEVLNHYLNKAKVITQERSILETALSPIAREVIKP